MSLQGRVPVVVRYWQGRSVALSTASLVVSSDGKGRKGDWKGWEVHAHSLKASLKRMYERMKRVWLDRNRPSIGGNVPALTQTVKLDFTVDRLTTLPFHCSLAAMVHMEGHWSTNTFRASRPFCYTRESRKNLFPHKFVACLSQHPHSYKHARLFPDSNSCAASVCLGTQPGAMKTPFSFFVSVNSVLHAQLSCKEGSALHQGWGQTRHKALAAQPNRNWVKLPDPRGWLDLILRFSTLFFEKLESGWRAFGPSEFPGAPDFGQLPIWRLKKGKAPHVWCCENSHTHLCGAPT